MKLKKKQSCLPSDSQIYVIKWTTLSTDDKNPSKIYVCLYNFCIISLMILKSKTTKNNFERKMISFYPL